MGIIHKPRLKMYWSHDELLSTPIFSKVMLRDRFLLLHHFLHFTDNEAHDPDDPQRDRLYKIREISDMIRHNSKEVYGPGRSVCVDESLLLYKGRLAFKQFIRSKLARFGVKFYELCTSPGIGLDYFIYTGNPLHDEAEGNPDSMTTTELIAADLVKPFLGKGHCLYIDNFYTSPRLVKHLLEHNTHVCGTVSSNRKNFPKDLADAPIDKGQCLFYEHGCMLASKYRANESKSGNKPKIVHMLSTGENAETTIVGQNRHGVDIIKPTCVVDYNKNMGGVDMVDQQLHMVQTVRKTYKWYKKVFLRIMMQCLLNAPKLFLLKHPEEKRRKDFLSFGHDVAASLIACSPRMALNATPIPTVSRLTERHFPKMKPATSEKDPRPTKMCKVCYAKEITLESGKTPKTRWICPDCPEQPGLHTDIGCFKEYHTQEDYSK